MGLARRGGVLWAAMVLGGVALGAYVLLAWPDATSRLVRLPYGESMPKSVRAAAQQPEAAVAEPAAEEVRVPAAAPVAEPELAAAEPVTEYEGPPPVGSELDGSYVESAEELGAEPLPGFGPEPAPAADDGETKTAAPAPEEPDDDEPVLDVVIELPQPPSAAE